MPLKNENGMHDFFSTLVPPFSILLSGMVLSFLTILTLAAEWLATSSAVSVRRTARKGHLVLATNRGKVLIATTQKD